ncbi:MAG: crotonase/enoyl-CoA hydratase family protein [Abyssibacter sp.]|nr:crotonase/enoyl-CoA hydratase family protein [Abyssibacter sp.]MBB87591.1 enoyl-CoA hydratase [Xanthomonadales bacterium]MCK5859130.1 crotonase/enoyl-CoA hydratase family protein [Abyssibacter sp.]
MTTASNLVLEEVDGTTLIVTINRPDVRNCVDGPTAAALADAFRRFDADPTLSVAILTGAAGAFCAGADLKAVQSQDPARSNRMEADGDAPMGVSRMRLDKPVIAAVEGHAVAGGLELALWCDLRVAAETAVFGVYCRRFGVPLIDGGTVRLPRLIGHGRAMDMILTGRTVDAREAYSIGLANRIVPTGQALDAAKQLAGELALLPQQCMRNDRRSALEQWALDESDALRHEFALGLDTLASGETLAGARRFTAGQGRHGQILGADQDHPEELH